MKKYCLILILLFIFVLSVSGPCFAKDKIEQILVKEVPKSMLTEELESFIRKNNFSIDKVSKDKTVYFVSKNDNGVIGNLIFYLSEKTNGTEIYILNKNLKLKKEKFINKNQDYIAAKKFYHQLKHRCINKYCELGCVLPDNDEFKKDIVNILNKEVIDNLAAMKKVDVSEYPKIDPDFVENENLIKKNIFEKDNRKITVFDSEYSVKIKDKVFFYYKEGNLKKLSIIDNSSPYDVQYVYNYPQGLLKGYSIYLKDKDSYAFDALGKFIDFYPYMKKLDSKIKSNWHPVEYKKTVVFFQLDKQGNLSKLKVVKKSNNSISDEAELNAIKNSAPFEPLPENYDDDTIDIQFTF